MDLSPESVTQIQRGIKKDFDIDISEKEAREKGSHLLLCLLQLMECLPPDVVKMIEETTLDQRNEKPQRK